MRIQAYEERFPHMEAKNEMYTEEVPNCVKCPDHSAEVAYQVGYWQRIATVGNSTFRRLRLTKWMYWCSRCDDKEALAPHWWGRAIRGDFLEAEEE